jgi:hypothetical protein
MAALGRLPERDRGEPSLIAGITRQIMSCSQSLFCPKGCSMTNLGVSREQAAENRRAIVAELCDSAIC